MDDNCNNQSLLVACIEWLKAELERKKYCIENAVGAPAWGRRILGRPVAYEVEQPSMLCDRAIRAVKSGDFVAAKYALLDLQNLLQAPMDDISAFGGRDYNSYLGRLIEVFNGGPQSVPSRERLIGIWFDMVHGWRGKSAKGVPTVPDMSKFMLVEWVATVFLIGIGIVWPTVQSRLGGIYLLVPTVFFALMCVVNAAGYLIKNTDLRLVYFLANWGMGFVLVSYFQESVTGWVLWSWAGGVIVGVLICAHFAYMCCRRMATKYGPFACLWARHIKHHTYEFLMVKTDGTLAWHYIASGWYKNMDPVLGNNLAVFYRSALRQLGFESYPNGGWFPCYVGLVSTRMVGLRRRNPVDWAEASRTTPDLTEELIEKFFTDTPSPLGPPQELQDSPAVELPAKTAIPW